MWGRELARSARAMRDCLRKFRVPGLHHAIPRALTSCSYVMPITPSEGLSTDTLPSTIVACCFQCLSFPHFLSVSMTTAYSPPLPSGHLPGPTLTDIVPPWPEATVGVTGFAFPATAVETITD